MEVDAVDLVVEDEDVVIEPVLHQVAIMGLVGFGADDVYRIVLNDRTDSGGGYNHEVDRLRTGSSSITTSLFAGSSSIVQVDGGVEPTSGNADDPHAIEGFDVTLDVALGVEGGADDVLLQTTIGSLGDEQDSALHRDFVVVHGSLGEVDSTNDIGSAGSDSGGYGVTLGSTGGEGSETISIDLGDYLGSQEFSGESAERHSESLFVVHGVDHEPSATILGEGVGFPHGGDSTVSVAVVSAVIAKTLDGQLQQFDLVAAKEADVAVSRIEDGGQGFSLVNFIQDGKEVFSKSNAVRKSHFVLLIRGRNKTSVFYVLPLPRVFRSERCRV